MNEIGFSFKDGRIEVRVRAFICDAPTRALILQVQNQSSDRHGCARCRGSGVNIGQIRTNCDFREKRDRYHHYGRSVIEDIDYVDMVKDFVLDPMHLVDLGVMKRMLVFLFAPKRRISGVSLPANTIRRFNKFLFSIRKCISLVDFVRHPRSH